MTDQSFRLQKRQGRLDTRERLGFTFNGKQYYGYQGDTLASALLANGVHLVGRSFKYHRPRGVFSAGAEEPNALVQLGEGARTDPNMRATQVPLYDGLVAHSQNCWPSVEFDVNAANDRVPSLIPAGFYYKTFMWPAKFWPFYERKIREAAGMGEAPREPDPDRYEHYYVHTDVLVLGGGGAGLAAAHAAGQSGARVILCDEQNELGGSLLTERGELGATIDGKPAQDWASETVDSLERMEEVTLLRRTLASGYYDDNYVLLLEHVTDHLGPGRGGDVPRQRLWKVRAQQVIVAAGAIERPLVFAGNDRPGIMLASAARTYVNRYCVRPGDRAVIFTNNDSAYLAALDLYANGVDIQAIADLRSNPSGDAVQKARQAGLPIHTATAITGTDGRKRVKRVTLEHLDENGEATHGHGEKIDCDCVAMSGGWNPTVHLFSQSKGKLRYEPSDGTYVPGQAWQQVRVAGAANGLKSLGEHLNEGQRAGTDAAKDAGFTLRKPNAPKVGALDGLNIRLMWEVPAPGKQKKFVDFQNDVAASDIRLALLEGYSSVEHVKRYTTTGMGTDQGKTSNVNALGIIAKTSGVDVTELGATTFRPPYTPTTFAAFVGLNREELYAPIRRTPMQSWHEAHGALFEDVGQWKRPWYYLNPGESYRDALNRECRTARTDCAILDGTTLGKIDVQGPDAHILLNWVYINAWNKCPIGHCRYSVMCKDDGVVLDDGVTARLGENHYLMSTTSSNAPRVMSWLELWLQTEWPDLRVHITSVTEQYAVASVCGPNAHALVSEVVDDIDMSEEAFPFMKVREGHVLGAPARVFRISFTGDYQYEINVPARFGLSLWEELIKRGEKYNITPYGTEAMHLLRGEKGFIIPGQDTDATVTPLDLGMHGLISKKKSDFLGKRGMAMADKQRANRWELVGLLPEDPNEVLDEGAHLVEEVKPEPPMKMIGFVTSSYYSPNLERAIALGLVEQGSQRKGQVFHVAMPHKAIPVKLTDTVFIDDPRKKSA